jgi:DNA-binding MarR family transcriptional regulator
MTEWLSDSEQQLWRSFLRGSTRVMNSLDDSLQRTSGLAMTDYEILVMLSESVDQQLRMSDLADRVLISRSRLTYRVDQLIRRELVERVECDDDRRGTFARLTPTGLATLTAAAGAHVADVRRLVIDHVNPHDLVRFTELLQSIDAGASVDSGNAS